MIKQVIATLAITTLTAHAGANTNETFILKDNSGLAKSKEVQKDFNLEPLFPSLGLYTVKSDGQNKSELELKFNGSQNRLGIQSESATKIFVDHPMTLRRLDPNPNDQDFDDQWSLQDFSETFGTNAKDAWAITKGEKTALGKEVVIAAVDGGFDLTHADLVDNVWVNKAEIPDNGIDDDNNGYIDDINGWNASSNNGNIQSSSHGTHVIGTMGATGGNNLDVVGVNWNTKIMVVSAGRSLGSTSTVLKSYNYILEQKKKWLETKGEEGANVVAINSSFGIDFADCTTGDYTLWNDVYNELGKYGILSAAATANRDIDVDKRGDVPTGCSSPYIVAVTNSTNRGKRNSRAGYGFESIDLAAPGTDILSTLPNNRTGNNTGTSMATPHVAGTVGLLHAAASEELALLTEQNPAAAALIYKEILLSTVSKVKEFEGQLKSPGILNIGAAATAAHSYAINDDEDGEVSDEDTDQEEGSDDSEDTTDEEETDSVYTSEQSVDITDAFIFNGVTDSVIFGVKNVNSYEDLEININIQHTHMEDLSLELIAPNGKSVLLRYKESGEDSMVMNYSVDSESFEALSNLGTSIPAGNWVLKITDHSYQDSGQLNNWSITVKN